MIPILLVMQTLKKRRIVARRKFSEYPEAEARYLLKSIEVCHHLQETNYGSEDKEKTILQSLTCGKRRLILYQNHR
jgi:hypothetical protein